MTSQNPRMLAFVRSLPKVDFAFAYGSAVIAQTAHVKTKVTLLVLLLHAKQVCDMHELIEHHDRLCCCCGGCCKLACREH